MGLACFTLTMLTEEDILWWLKTGMITEEERPGVSSGSQWWKGVALNKYSGKSAQFVDRFAYTGHLSTCCNIPIHAVTRNNHVLRIQVKWE